MRNEVPWSQCLNSSHQAESDPAAVTRVTLLTLSQNDCIYSANLLSPRLVWLSSVNIVFFFPRLFSVKTGLD